MEEDTNQPLTPLKNERRDNPGQTKVFENSNGDSVVPTTPSWTNDTSLEDIAQQYIGIGGKYNDLVENAADNVGDRQAQLVGNDFGATNPYMFNTYYEPAATSFASEMRMQGTQKAAEVGLDRAEKEAQEAVKNAQNRYNNALAAAKEKENQKRNANVHISETDSSAMPADTSEDEVNAFAKLTEGMTDEEKAEAWKTYKTKELQNKSPNVNWNEDWRSQYSTDFRRARVDDATWKNMSKEERDAWWADPKNGNAWTEGYMLKYFDTYGKASGISEMMRNEFQKIRNSADLVVNAINNKDIENLHNYNLQIAQISITKDLNAANENININVIKKAVEQNEKISQDEKDEFYYLIDTVGEDKIRDTLKTLIDGEVTKVTNGYGVDYVNNRGQSIKPGSTDLWGQRVFGSVSGVIEAFGGADKFNDAILNEYELTKDALANEKATYEHFSNLPAEELDAQSFDDMMKETYGVDYSSLVALSDLKENDPEKYQLMRDHCSFAKAGGTAAFEVVTDKNKKYYINGKYWSAADEDSPISEGDLIFHSIDGTIKSDGKYTDENLQRFVDLYKDIYNGDKAANDENLAALQKYYNDYAKVVAFMTYVASVNDIKVDENLYSVYLGMLGGARSKLEIVDPRDPSNKTTVDSVTEWFNGMSNDEKYNTYTALVNKAYKSRGYLLIMGEGDQVTKRGLKTNGIDTVGKYGKSRSDANMKGARQVEGLTDDQAFAILSHIDWMMHDGTINKGFLPNDEVQGMDSFVNSFAANAKGFGQFWAWAGAGIVGGIKQQMGYSDKDNPEAKFAGEVWKDMTTLDEGDDWGWAGKDDMTLFNQYTEDVRKQQRANLNHLIDTTFNLDYFDPTNHIKDGVVVNEKGEEVKLDNMNYNHMDDWKAFTDMAYGMAGAIAEFAAESAVTAGIGKAIGAVTGGAGTVLAGIAEGSGKMAKVATAILKAKNTIVRVMTAPMTRDGLTMAVKAGQASSNITKVASTVGDDVVRAYLSGSAKTLKEAADQVDNIADDVARAGVKAAANNVDNVADDAAKAATKVVSDNADNVVDDFAKAGAKAASSSTDNVADDVAEAAVGAARSRVDDLGDDAIKFLEKTLDESKDVLQKDYAYRYGLDVIANNVDDAATSFGKRFMDKINKIAESGYIDKKLVSNMRSQLDNLSASAASRTAINERLATKLGVDVSRIQNISDDAADALYGIMRASEQNADDISTAIFDQVSRRTAKAGKDVALGKIDFQKSGNLVLEQIERIASRGGKMTVDDIFRTFATQGAIDVSDLLKSLRRSEFIKDRIKDWTRDIAQNYWTPDLDQNFESHYVDFGTYITSPQQWGMGILFDVGSTGLRSLGTRSKLFWTNQKINKIMGGIDATPANKADLAEFKKQIVKLDRLRAKSVKLQNKVLDGTISFKKVHSTAVNAEDAVKTHIKSVMDKFDIDEIALVVDNSDAAMAQANRIINNGDISFRNKRKYRKVLADADEFNRIIVRGNNKLMAVSEASQALQQVSILRYLDIDKHAQTIHKLTGEQWGKTWSATWADLSDVAFAAKYGDQIGFDGKAFKSKSTINFDDPAKTKEVFRAGQTLLYDTLYDKVKETMGDSLTTQDYRELKVELNAIRDRMIEAGNQLIDDGKKVRWNYVPTQALTWEAEPGTMSAVRALWGWDYKGGEHTFFAGEVNNPSLVRDAEDFSTMISDFNGGVKTFKRRKGEIALDTEAGRKPTITPEDFKDVPYNYAGFDPAYACNAYLNSFDSARIIQPMLDPINGIISTNPELASSAIHLSNLVLEDEIKKISTKYNDAVNSYTGNRHSAKSLERRAKLSNDLQTSISNIYGGSAPEQDIVKIKAANERITAGVREKINNSPMIKSLESLYSRTFTEQRIPADARRSFVIGKLNTAFHELGDDIKAVREMYTKGGKIKKKYLDADGNVLPKYLDAQGNLVPDGKLSGTYSNINGTQYREFVNGLAKNKNLKSSYFDDGIKTIDLGDGNTINAQAFQKNIFDVLATKQATDLGVDTVAAKKQFDANALELAKARKENAIPKIRTRAESAEIAHAALGKYLEPIDIDSDRGRVALSDNATKILNDLFGERYNTAKGESTFGVRPGSKKDKIIHSAISKALDEAESTGGQMSTLDFVGLVDKHIPDFMKDSSKAAKSTTETFLNSLQRIRSFENNGGSADELIRDLSSAYFDETHKATPDAHKVQVIKDAIAILSGEELYGGRTTNRAAFNESLDFEVGVDDSGAVTTSGDITPDVSATTEVNGTYIPKGANVGLESDVETFTGNWTAKDVKNSADKVFLFGDNIEDAKTGYKPKSTQAVIRGEENAIGIPTKKNRGRSAASYFTDADFDEFKAGVDNAIAEAKASGKTIVLPENGIGTGAAQLQKRAPKCFKYLQEQLDSLSTSSRPAQAAGPAKKFDMNMSDTDIDIAFATFDQEGKISKETNDAYGAYINAINAPDKEPVAGVTEAKGVAEKKRLIALMNKDVNPGYVIPLSVEEGLNTPQAIEDAVNERIGSKAPNDNIKKAIDDYKKFIKSKYDEIEKTPEYQRIRKKELETDAERIKWRKEHPYEPVGEIDFGDETASAYASRMVYENKDVIKKRDQIIAKIDNELNQDSAASSQPVQAPTGTRVKVISGGQTGVDTIGLEVGKELGLETGGTATPGFYREKNIDKYTAKDMAAFGLKEIDAGTQAKGAKTSKQFYLPRTEQNVINSDGTVYFSSNKNSAGYAATKRFADSNKKPFILNPTASQLREWMAANNVKTLNIAGSRGSHIDDNFSKHVRDVLNAALKDPIDSAPAKRVMPNPNSLAEALDIIGLYEVSTAGDQRFSALNAKFKDGSKVVVAGKDVSGMTVEEVWQKVAKQSDKNKPPKKGSPVDLEYAKEAKKLGVKTLTDEQKLKVNQRLYNKIWDRWGKENPELKADLQNKAYGRTLTDKFAKEGSVSQAKSLQRWVNNVASAPDGVNNFSRRRGHGTTKRKVFDKLETSFNKIADELDKKAESKIYRGDSSLVNSSDTQILSEMQKSGNKNVKIANRDIAAGRAYGNIEFWSPENIDDFVRRNNIELDAKTKKSIDAYKKYYNENASIVADTAYRSHVSDARTSMQQSIPDYFASFNSGDKTVFDLDDTYTYLDDGEVREHKEKNYSRLYKQYRDQGNLGNLESEFWKSNEDGSMSFKRAQNQMDTAENNLKTSPDLYERINQEAVSKAQKTDAYAEAVAARKDYIKARNDLDYAEDASPAVRKKLQKQFDEAKENFIAAKNNYTSELEAERFLISEREGIEYLGNRKWAETDNSIDNPDALYDFEGFEDRYRKLAKRERAAQKADDVNALQEIADERIELDKERAAYEESTAGGGMPQDRELPEEIYARKYSNQAAYSTNTPYMDYLDASGKYNISEAATSLNNTFYGDGDKIGYFDALSKNNAKLKKAQDAYDLKFNKDITDKLTELKKLNMAKDGEVVGILKKAKAQADDIEDEALRKYVVKRLDDEIKFAEADLTKSKMAARQAFVEHDPEYQAMKRASAQDSASATGNQISAALPTGDNPVFLDGKTIDLDGHITLQQVIDAQKEVRLSRKKNGGNTFKSTAEEIGILKDMRKGGNTMSSGAARAQDRWVCNLYARIMAASGNKLPGVPTLDDIEKGFMLNSKGKKVNLPLKLDEVYIDPTVASLGQKYWGSGTTTTYEAVHKVHNSIASFNKAIQDIQLAGGVGQYNAFTLRNAITMMWQDPVGGTKALFSNFYNARTNDSVINFYINNHDVLLKMAMDSGDFSALNAFTNVINTRDEVTGRGMISEFNRSIAEIPNDISENGIFKGIWGTTKAGYESMFGNPTFARWAAVAKADMQIRNYKKAQRYVSRMVKHYGLTEEDFANMEGGQGSMDAYIAHIAQMRTDQYWTPTKFMTSANNTEKYLGKQKADTLKRTTEALRSMPQKKTLRQSLSDYFFAIGYKLQMNAHPVSGMASIFATIPNNLRASSALRNRRSFTVASSRFASGGNRTQALVMVGIAGLAHAWNTHIGAPSAFEELYHNIDDAFGENGTIAHGTYGISQSLLNFQDFGKIYLPNTPEGTFDPTQKAQAVDPFFSVFTLQNSAMRAVNKAFNPTQIPRNIQRVGSAEPGSFWDRVQGVSDELIGANLLSGYKAIYEVLNNSTYFGNNIWEREYLPDGRVNPNYNQLRNMIASVAHILNTEELFTGDTTNKWVKGLSAGGLFGAIGEEGEWGVTKTGTVAGSGIIQHEYVTALKHINDGEYFEALTESMELPFKSRNFASRARTQLNTEVVMQLRNAKKEYDKKVENASIQAKNEAYAQFAEKAVNIMHDWSKKNGYILGDNDELTASATKILVSFMADEYDDATNRVQNRYDKMKQELKMAKGDEFLFSKESLAAAELDGLTDAEAAEIQNKHLAALKKAQDAEYKARQALIDAGLDPSVFNTSDYINDDLVAKTATFNKKTYNEILGKLESPIGEFNNFMEMKEYYEARIAEATTTKQKAKLANSYNDYVLGIISPYVEAGYGAAAFNNIYWDGDFLSNKLGKYIILPADKYYGGKTPRTNYLKDRLGIGYRDNSSLPSDKDVEEQLHKVAVALSKGNISSASALVDNALVQLRKGIIHASPEDYEKIIRMRALLSSRSR